MFWLCAIQPQLHLQVYKPDGRQRLPLEIWSILHQHREIQQATGHVLPIYVPGAQTLDGNDNCLHGFQSCSLGILANPLELVDALLAYRGLADGGPSQKHFGAGKRFLGADDELLQL